MPHLSPIDYHADSAYWFARLRDLPYACWLDSGKPASTYGRYDIISALPQTRFVTWGNKTEIYHRNGLDFNDDLITVSQDDPLVLLQEAISQLSQEITSELPFAGGAMGYFGYNLGRRYVSKKTVPHTKTARFADMQMGIYHWAIVQDHLYKKAWVVSLPECAPQVLTEIHKRILDTTLPTEPIEPLLVHNLHATITRDQYLKQFERIYDYLLAGDCYQVNFAQRFCADYSGDPYSAYQKLRTLMASPFSAYLKLGKQAIMSLSPERFLRVQDRKVITQPIKGTSPRQTDPLQDKQQAISLQKSEKNQAENVMIVDLLRNDLGQHCIPGSIRVDTLFGLQSFPNVHHLVSDISGTLQNNSHSLDLLRSCFPGGSITGAPKRRAMEIIDELESNNRGVYCGSIGYISNSGNIDTNIAIRTVSCDGEQLHCWGGGGIVIDSEAKAEYDESLNKINTILQALKDSTTD